MLLVPIEGPLDASVRLPGSKSLTNRALVSAALATGRSVLEGALLADDTEAMIDGLGCLGITVTVDAGVSVRQPVRRVGGAGESEAAGEPDRTPRVWVDGCAGTLPDGAVGARLDARLSGTTARFLLPVLALGPGPTWLDGAAPLRSRPMADGIAALRHLGAQVEEEGAPGHLPVVVRGTPLEPAPKDASRVGSSGAGSPVAAEITVRGDASSQFLSGLLVTGPALPAGLRLTVEGHLVSRPYVAMTAAVMQAFGASVAEEVPGTWLVAPGGYRATTYQIEPDASAASYVFAAAAICGGRVTVAGLGKDSLQGDVGFVDVLAQMGCHVEHSDTATTVEGTGALSGVDVDMGNLSDTAQTLAAVAVFADSPTRLRGIGFIRSKETDRVGNVVRELRRCGIRADEEEDGLVVYPGTPRPARIETYHDHRMAMSFALLGLRAPGIEIADPDCVAKTFPGFWTTLDSLRPSAD